MSWLVHSLLVAITVCLVADSASANIVRVPSFRPALRSGIAAASSGDTVLVAAGTYTGASNRGLDFGGKVIHLLSEEGAAATIIDCEAATYGFYLNGEPEGSSIEGFTITNGVFGRGGGICLNGGSSLAIRACTFSGNSASISGGALACLNSSVSIENCEFLSNTGGAVFLTNTGWELIHVTDCRFVDNSGSSGAGMYCDNEVRVQLLRCEFLSNRAVGTFSRAGAVYSGDWGAHVRCVECTFAGNSAWGGGALFASLGSLDVSTSEFIGNTADSRGGAVQSYAGTVLEGCLFDSNASADQGGALWLTEGPLCSITSCTFVNSSAPSGACFYYWGFYTGPEFDRVIIAFSDGEAVAIDSDYVPLFSCSNIFGNTGGDWTGAMAGQLGASGNISADPLFCGFSNPGRPWTLHEDSPCAPPNSGACGLVGACPSECGVTAVRESSWGAIKQMFH